MNGVILYGKLDTNSAKATFQFRVDLFEILGWDISRMRIQFGQNLRHGFFHQIRHVYGVDILIVYNA